MYAGTLRERIDIYSPTPSSYSYSYIGEYGQRTNPFSLLYSTRADVRMAGGKRSVIDDEIQTPYEKEFITRIYVPVYDDSIIKYNAKKMQNGC